LHTFFDIQDTGAIQSPSAPDFTHYPSVRMSGDVDNLTLKSSFQNSQYTVHKVHCTGSSGDNCGQDAEFTFEGDLLFNGTLYGFNCNLPSNITYSNVPTMKLSEFVKWITGMDTSNEETLTLFEQIFAGTRLHT
jgi:hypothetical protein